MPFDAIIGTLRCLFSLAVLNLGLLIRSCLVVPGNDRLHGGLPQSLRLALALLFNRSGQGRGVLRMRSVEEQVLLVGLFELD